MGYYIRVLSPSAEPVQPSVLRDAAQRYGARFSENILPADLKDIEVLNAAGEALCMIERNSITEEPFASEEI